MQLQNFECQIAKAQIGRYLAGDALSDEAVQQLEAHIAKCPDCKQNLAERRAVLQAMLSPGEAGAPSQQARAKFDLAAFIKSKIPSRKPAQAVVQAEDAKPSTFTKPALYSLGLCVVLVGMSYLSKNMGSVLGPKAAETTVETPTTTSKPKPVVMADMPAANPSATRKAEVEPTDLPLTPPSKTPIKAPTKEPVVKPLTKVKSTKIQSKPASRRSHSHKAPRHHSSNTVRVYDPEN